MNEKKELNIITTWVGKGIDKSEKERRLELVTSDRASLKTIFDEIAKQRRDAIVLWESYSSDAREEDIKGRIANDQEKIELIERALKELEGDNATINTFNRNGGVDGARFTKGYNKGVAVPSGDGKTTEGTGALVTFNLTTKTITKAWEDFRTQFINQLHSEAAKLNDNLYTLNWKKESYDINENTGAERILFEFVYQLSRISEKDLTEAITKQGEKDGLLEVNSSNRKRFASNFGDAAEKYSVKKVNSTSENVTWTEKFRRLLAEVRAYGDELTENTYVMNNKSTLKFHELAESRAKNKEFTFNFEKVRELVSHLCLNADTSAIEFLDEALKLWKQGQDWHIWQVVEVNDETRAKLIENGELPSAYKNKRIKIYWTQPNRQDWKSGKDIKVDGLKGWFELYQGVFGSSQNLVKFDNSANYRETYHELCRSLIYKGWVRKNERNKTGDFEYTSDSYDDQEIFNEQFKEAYGIKVKNERGEDDYYPITYNVWDTIRDLKNKQAGLEAGKESKKGELSGTGAEANTYRKALFDIGTKIEAQEKLIVKHVESQIKKKQEALKSLKTSLLDSKTDWDGPKVIIDAAKAEKYLLDILWLQSGGLVGNRVFKENANLGLTKEEIDSNVQLLNKINNERDRLESAWHSIIKGKFVEEGSTDDIRIKKTKEKAGNGGIGLEAVRNSLLKLGGTENEALAAKIDKEILNSVVASDTPPLSTTDLNEALGISDSTSEMVTDWGNLGGGWGKLKDNVSGLFTDYADETKRNALITYIEGKSGNDFQPVKDAADNAAKFIAFKKLGAELIVKTLLEYENQAALSSNGSERAEIVKKMKETSDYNNDPKQNKFNKEKYGNPEEPEKMKPEQILAFLFDDKVRKIQARDTVWETTSTTDKSFFKKCFGKTYYYAGYWVPALVLILALVVIFWGTISKWWNGPAAEGDETEKNQEEDNE